MLRDIKPEELCEDCGRFLDDSCIEQCQGIVVMYYSTSTQSNEINYICAGCGCNNYKGDWVNNFCSRVWSE